MKILCKKINLILFFLLHEITTMHCNNAPALPRHGMGSQHHSIAHHFIASRYTIKSYRTYGDFVVLKYQ